MPVFQQILLEEGLVGIFHITETADILETNYANIFGKGSNGNEFQHVKRKREWLAVRLLIAELLGSDFSVFYDRNGKPEFQHEKYKYISISHSADYAAVSLHQNKPVGIDIESLNRRFAYVEKKYLSDDELAQVPNHPHLRAIYWSCKEAIFKWAGREGVDFRKQIKVNTFNPEQDEIICAEFRDEQTSTVQLRFFIFEGHVVAYTI